MQVRREDERFFPVLNISDTGAEEIGENNFPFRECIIHHERSISSPPVSVHVVEIQPEDRVIDLVIVQFIVRTPKFIGRKISPFQIALSKYSKLIVEKSSLYTPDILVIVVLVVRIG